MAKKKTVPTEQPEWLTQTEFAKRVKVSQPRIAKLMKAGRLKGATKLEGKRVMINFQKASEILAARIDPMNPGKIRAALAELTPEEKKQVVNKAGVPGMDYYQARTFNEQYKAALKKLEYDEKNGKLLNADLIRESVSVRVLQVRDAILNIPDRVASILAVEGNEDVVRELLAAELRTALNDLSAGMV